MSHIKRSHSPAGEDEPGTKVARTEGAEDVMAAVNAVNAASALAAAERNKNFDAASNKSVHMPENHVTALVELRTSDEYTSLTTEKNVKIKYMRWQKLVDTINERFGTKYTHEQITNKWQYERSSYRNRMNHRQNNGGLEVSPHYLDVYFAEFYKDAQQSPSNNTAQTVAASMRSDDVDDSTTTNGRRRPSRRSGRTTMAVSSPPAPAEPSSLSAAVEVLRADTAILNAKVDMMMPTVTQLQSSVDRIMQLLLDKNNAQR